MVGLRHYPENLLTLRVYQTCNIVYTISQVILTILFLSNRCLVSDFIIFGISGFRLPANLIVRSTFSLVVFIRVSNVDHSFSG